MSGEKYPIRVLISGAAGQIGYALIPLVADGRMFGPKQPIILHLLDITPAMTVLNGVVMEIQDCSYPLVRGIVATDSYEIAFKDVNWAILVGGFPRKKGMERKDLLQRNASIYIGTGKALNANAAKGVKVLVVANPANTNALTLSQNAPSIPKENITAMTRLDMNRAVGNLASKLSVRPQEIKNVVIWGNHSKTQIPYANAAFVNNTSLPEKLNDDNYLNSDFVTAIQNRGAEVIAARGLSSAMSAANGIKDHIYDWYNGTKTDEFVSMSVISDGNKYGIAKGLMFSFPVTIKDQKWKIVDGLQFNDNQKKLLKITEQELIEEREEASSST